MKLYSLIIFLDIWFKGNWVVENVRSYYNPLIKPTAIIDHHFIWSNISLRNKKYSRPGNLKDLNTEILCGLLHIDYEFIKSFTIKNWGNHDSKRQILRNCVLPEVGKYILDSIKTITLMDFITEKEIP